MNDNVGGPGGGIAHLVPWGQMARTDTHHTHGPLQNGEIVIKQELRGLWRLKMFWSAPQTGFSGSRISTVSNESLNCSISRLNINPHGAYIHGHDIQ